MLPEHFKEVKARKTEILDKTEKAVKERLTAEIQYWDYRAAELKEKENAGKRSDRLNSQKAARRAEDLQMRMQARLGEIAKERMVSAVPPVVTAVIFAQLVDDPSSYPDLFPTVEAQDKERRRLFEIIKNLVRWENINNDCPVMPRHLQSVFRKHRNEFINGELKKKIAYEA